MFSRLLSQADLGRVIAAAPPPRFEVHELSRWIMRVLIEDPTCTLSVKKIAEFVNEKQELGGHTGWEISPKQIGSALTEMGICHYRTRDGYVAYWSQEQLDILSQVLKEVK